MDPQQRLLLEVAIEALDDAGLPHERLRGSRTGVFIASYHNDYAQLQYNDLEAIDARTLTGTLHSVLANRLSYFLDLRGPSISIDTACSSSLVAVHLACQSLRSGESDIAIAGGVSLMITPELMVAMSKVGFMAPDGRCKTFDAQADGFGRGEGCGVVVLKRLADAIADGDRMLAVIRGSAVNQDGHSTLLAAPNGLAQQALIREALANGAARAGAHRLRRDARHRHRARRSDRGRGDRGDGRPACAGRGPLLPRLRQGQPRPSRGRRRRGRPDQGRARAAPRGGAAAGPLHQAQPAHLARRHPACGADRADAVAGRPRCRAARRSARSASAAPTPT